MHSVQSEEQLDFMTHEINADLLEFSLDGFIHQANCFHTFGAGIAKRIKEKYPELYKADMAHGRRGDINRLGSFSFTRCHDGKIGYNLYGQFQFGTWTRQTNYEAIYKGLDKIKTHAEENVVTKLGLPNKMGCVLGGGDFRIIRVMIEVIFEKSPIELYICNYDPVKANL